MKICIPVLEKNGIDSRISGHFGRTPVFAIVNEENNNIKDIEFHEIQGKHSGGHVTSGEIVFNSEADILLAGNMGPKAVAMLKEADIELLTGAKGTIKETFELWKNNKLQTAKEDNCKEHSGHDC